MFGFSDQNWPKSLKFRIWDGPPCSIGMFHYFIQGWKS